MSRVRAQKGVFISLEGGEGAGKSTQAQVLAEWFRSRGRTVEVSREPGGTTLGLSIRKLLLENTKESVSSRAQLLLFAADRAQHVETKILPSLKRGEVFITDRFEDSSTVYQGLSQGLGQAPAQWINRFATAGLRPNLVVIIDVEPKLGLARANARRGAGGVDRMEAQSLAFHEKVRKGFLKLARTKAARYAVIDGSGTVEQIASAIQKAVVKKLKGLI